MYKQKSKPDEKLYLDIKIYSSVTLVEYTVHLLKVDLLP